LEELAHLAGTSNQQISHLEAGKRKLTVDWLVRLAGPLECHPWEIVSTDTPTAVDPGEMRLLQAFRALKDQHQRILLDLASALRAKPAAKTKARRSTAR
jgi:transcriptional regulator with XRE-family HTH domain